MKRLTQEDVSKTCEKRGYLNAILLPEKTKHGRSLIKFTCTFGASHNQLWDTIRSEHGCGCPRVSYPENLIRQLLEWWTGAPCPKLTKREIVAITKDTTDAPFEIDIYCRKHSLGIEVDGDLHRKGWNGAKSSADAIAKRDAEKDMYFTRNQFTLGSLLRISTEELRGKSITDVATSFSAKMKALKLPGPTTEVFEYGGQPTRNQARLAVLRMLAAEKGVHLVDDEYANNTTKHTFTCKKHGNFLISPNYLLRNAFGCTRCAKLQTASKLRARSALLSLDEATRIASALNIATYETYVAMFRTGLLPKGLPGNPYVVYKKEPDWRGIRTFLGRT